MGKRTAKSLMPSKSRRKRADKGSCFFKGCKINGSRTHHCNICEIKGRKKVHTVQFCELHADHATEKMKAHVLLRHPSMIPAFIATDLAGKSLPWTKRDIDPHKKKG